MAIKDLTNLRFGRLLVLNRLQPNQWGNYIWLCKCDCGNYKEVSGGLLKRGDVRSCGCLRHETMQKRWNDMKNPNKYKVNGDCVEVTLSAGEIMLCDENDWMKLKNHRWHRDNTTGYARTGVTSKMITFHREIVHVPEGLVVDHINHNKLDNRKLNLRVVTQSINLLNSKASGITQIKGYEKWAAQIMINRRHIYLGSYDNKDEAIAVYKGFKENYIKSQTNNDINGTLTGNINNY